jgi:hypothetical protein
VQPLVRDKKFAARWSGVIALAEDNLIAPALHENLPRDTDAVLVDSSGQIIYPPDRERAAEGSGWAAAIAAAARGTSGTLTAERTGSGPCSRSRPCTRPRPTRWCSRGPGGR